MSFLACGYLEIIRMTKAQKKATRETFVLYLFPVRFALPFCSLGPTESPDIVLSHT